MQMPALIIDFYASKAPLVIEQKPKELQKVQSFH